MVGALSAATISPNLLTQTPQTTTADLMRGKARDAAQKFESQFLAQMLGQMFQGIDTDGPFGGGHGEEMFRSLLTDSMAKDMTKAGGIGLADTVQREILKLQGLT
jgi:Rod binding domain-containing protein